MSVGPQPLPVDGDPAGHFAVHPSSTDEKARSQQTSQQPQGQQPLHRLLTLPLALHIPPIPTLHYQAVPTSSDDEDQHSFEEEQSQSDSLQITSPHTSLIGSNLRLQPLVIQPPPHDIDTISFLLDKSHARQAIQPLLQLLTLLDSADEDIHFRNLCEFFDARYDLETGLLVGLEREAPQNRPQRKARQSSGMLSKMTSLSRKARGSTSESASLHPRSASSSLGQTGGSLLATLRKTQDPGRQRSPSVFSDEGNGRSPSSYDIDDLTDALSTSDLDVISEQHLEHDDPTQPPKNAPHLVVPLKSAPQASRSIAFPVRLDLHNAASGLCEPPPARSSARSNTMRTRKVGEGSTTGMASLNRVVSPSSARSNGSMRSSSRSRSSSEVNQYPPQGQRATSPRASGFDRNTTTTDDQQQHLPPLRRRSSALQRFLGFKGSRNRRRIRESSMGSNEDDIEEDHITPYTADSQNFVAVGSDDDDDDRDGENVPPVPPLPAHLVSENHFAGPPASAVSANQPSLGTMGLAAATVPDVGSSNVEQATWTGTGKDLDDLLSLLRKAADAGLRLPSASTKEASATESSYFGGKSRKGQQAGVASPASSSASIQDPPLPDDVYSRALRGETTSEKEAWWPSGGVDPIPVSICSALALFFRWDGILRLCYGPGSPMAASSSNGREPNGSSGHAQGAHGLAALGRAAAEAARIGEESKEAEESIVGMAVEGKDAKPARTWSDWHRLFNSLSGWVELYEMTRIRGGLAREIGLDKLSDDGLDDSHPLATHHQYSLSSGTIPAAVSRDASHREKHAYRRRLGIPEGLPANEDGIELGDYRWSRNRLGAASVATSLTITASSLAHSFHSLATTDLTYASSWELDYLEALALKSPVIATRFPPPIARPITSVSHPFDETRESQEMALALAKPAPNPSPEGCFVSEEWTQWLSNLKAGQVITPVVSVQAWWAVIALICSDQQDLALQILDTEENWKTIKAEGESNAEGLRSSIWI